MNKKGMEFETIGKILLALFTLLIILFVIYTIGKSNSSIITDLFGRLG